MSVAEVDQGQLTNEGMKDFLNELDKRLKGGDKVVHPGRDIGTPTNSAMRKSGAEAMQQDGDKGNFAVFQNWEDPAEKMDPKVRQAMLMKSLNDIGYEYKGHWDSLGGFLKEGYSHHKSPDFMAKHKESFANIRNRADFFKARGMTTVNGEDGGYLVNPEIAPTIEWLFNKNTLSGRVDTINTSQTIFRWPRAKDLNRNDGTRHGGILSYWIDEGDTGTESRPKLTFTELRMKKLAVFVFMTSEIASDTPYAIEQYVKTAVREEVDFAINRAIMWGAGGVEPVGFANSGATVSVAKQSGQTGDTFVYENALNMLSRMYRTSQSQAVWLHHQSVIPEIGRLNLNNYPVSVNIQTGGASNSVISTLLGRQAIESELCAPLGDTGDVWYVDPKMYKAISQSTIREDVSMHVEFMSDQNCLRFIFRFDGSPLFPTPITPFKAPGAAGTPPTQSSFVKLDVRS